MNEPKPHPRDIMSDTPQTDALAARHEHENKDYHYRWHDYNRLACQLERELAQAQARCAEARNVALEEAAKRMDAAFLNEYGSDYPGSLIRALKG